MNRYDNDFADDLSQPVTSTKARPGWFKRNWLWLVPLVILLPLFCCCGGPIGLMWLGISEFQKMPPYQDSLAAAQSNAEVQQALGSPIEVGGFMGIPTDGSELDVQYNSSGATFVGYVPIKGPNDSANIYIEASSADSVNWTYTVQEVQLNDGTVIDLLSGSGGAIDIDTGELIDSAVEAIEQSREERGLTIPDQE